MHHSVLLTSCVDIDGVLCADPSKEQNDDGDAYLQFLAQARPLIVPTVPVGWLVTSRLEKYRDQTERWLAANGVQYRELVMMNAPTRQHRVAAGSHAPYKAQFYCDSGADLFIESEASLALEICELSGKPVFCAETREMVYPTSIGPSRHKGVGTRGANESSVRAAPAGVSDWTSRLQAGIRQALELVRPGRSFILLDQEQWGLSDSFAGRRRIPFPQSDGLYSGPPADGPAALRELATALSADAEYFVIGWPAYWWLDHYPGFAAHLESRFRCVIRNELLTAYELRPAGSESRRQQCSNVLTEDPLISGA